MTVQSNTNSDAPRQVAHTPTPWKSRVDDSGHPDCGLFSEIRQGQAYSVARCPRYQTRERWEADADFICRAANCHDDLVALLKRSREELRLIRMKDSAAVYDVTLRIEMDMLIDKAEAR